MKLAQEKANHEGVVSIRVNILSIKKKNKKKKRKIINNKKKKMHFNNKQIYNNRNENNISRYI